MARAVSIYWKKKVELGRLTIPQKSMAVIGFAAVREINARTAAGIGPTDGPAKPLSKKWAAIKRNMRLKPIRDLRGHGLAFGNQLTRAKKRKKTGKRFIGHMMDAFTPRTVRDNEVRLGMGPFAARVKAVRNQLREPWMILSTRNIMALQPVIGRAWSAAVKQMVRVVVLRAA